jgi:hypothetical protein
MSIPKLNEPEAKFNLHSAVRIVWRAALDNLPMHVFPIRVLEGS